MRRRPREAGSAILDTRVLRSLFVTATLMTVATLTVLTLADEESATTLAFTTFVLLQLVNVLAVRGGRSGILGRHQLTNKWVWAALALVLLVQVAVVHRGGTRAPVGRVAGDLDRRARVYSTDLDPDHLPGHVAIIMDGNGRWANARGLKRNAGHEAGEAALFDVVEGALALGIDYLTVYAFSTENWKRPADEVRFLMGFNESLLLRRKDELHERRVRVRFIGRRKRPVPRRLVELMEDTEALTADNTRMTLGIAFNYGGHAEILDAARELAHDYAEGRVKRIDERALESRLYDPDMPPVDLLIRTSGEQRTSNFLPWQAAYAELVFVETLWPDFNRIELEKAVVEYQRRERRFGKAVDKVVVVRG